MFSSTTNLRVSATWPAAPAGSPRTPPGTEEGLLLDCPSAGRPPLTRTAGSTTSSKSHLTLSSSTQRGLHKWNYQQILWRANQSSLLLSEGITTIYFDLDMKTIILMLSRFNQFMTCRPYFSISRTGSEAQSADELLLEPNYFLIKHQSRPPEENSGDSSHWVEDGDAGGRSDGGRI